MRGASELQLQPPPLTLGTLLATCGCVLASETDVSSGLAVELSRASVDSWVAFVVLMWTSGVAVTETPLLASSRGRWVPSTCLGALLGCELGSGLV